MKRMPCEVKIPAKTFLIGEYVALLGGPAILLNTSPYFSLKIRQSKGLAGIHKDSPAGKWWQKYGSKDTGIQFDDPYFQKGGLGASSAQFIGMYSIKNDIIDEEKLLSDYYQFAWNGEGLRPSAYDILAQTKKYPCVFIEKNKNDIEEWGWPFSDLGFLLIHTGKKIATHNHLQVLQLTENVNTLKDTVYKAKTAFLTKDSSLLTAAINTYYQQLNALHLVASHTQDIVNLINKMPGVLACKGCGALGADTILVFVAQNKLESICQKLKKMKLDIIATQQDLIYAL
ncbi:hypothetical protein [Legionella adelaidensis]|nr:hypothetical protein [Legionella adelaidensis]